VKITVFMKINQIILIVFGFFLQPACAQQKEGGVTTTRDTSQRYEIRDSQSADGTGKFYMGREIAHVMGHTGAGWLERPRREREERTDLLLKELKLDAADVVADVGAGSGYFTFRMASLVPQGKVLAVDIQPEMLDEIRSRMKKTGARNVVTVLGTVSDPRLPAGSLDVALFVDAYHEFSHPYEMMQNVAKALKPGGRVVLVEYRAEDPDVPIKPRHKMTEAQAVKEMAAVGLEFTANVKSLPQQHLLIFRKPAQ
jgi:ubiquinone/menaquinone biosynthesis C-methylase UbiE